MRATMESVEDGRTSTRRGSISNLQEDNDFALSLFKGSARLGFSDALFSISGVCPASYCKSARKTLLWSEARNRVRPHWPLREAPFAFNN